MPITPALPGHPSAGALNAQSQPAEPRANATVAPAGVPRTAAATPRGAPELLRAIPDDAFGKITDYLNVNALGTLRQTSAGMNTKLTTEGPTAAVFAAVKTDTPWKREIRDTLARLDAQSRLLIGHRSVLLLANRPENDDAVIAINMDLRAIAREQKNLRELERREPLVIANAARLGRIAAPFRQGIAARSAIEQFRSQFASAMRALDRAPSAQRAAKAVELLSALAPHFETLASRDEQVDSSSLVLALLPLLRFDDKKALQADLARNASGSAESVRPLLVNLQATLKTIIEDVQPVIAESAAKRRELLVVLTSDSKDVETRAALAQDLLLSLPGPDMPGLDFFDVFENVLSFDMLKSEVQPDQVPRVLEALGSFNSGVASPSVMDAVRRLQAVFTTGEDPYV